MSSATISGVARYGASLVQTLYALIRQTVAWISKCVPTRVDHMINVLIALVSPWWVSLRLASCGLWLRSSSGMVKVGVDKFFETLMLP